MQKNTVRLFISFSDKIKNKYFLEEQQLKLNKVEFFDKIQESHDDLKWKLKKNGYQIVPKPLAEKFGQAFESEKTKYSDEL